MVGVLLDIVSRPLVATVDVEVVQPKLRVGVQARTYIGDEGASTGGAPEVTCHPADRRSGRVARVEATLLTVEATAKSGHAARSSGEETRGHGWI